MNLVGTQYSLEHKALEIFIAGCREHPCKGCHNQELWDETIGEELNEERYEKLKGELLLKLEMIDNFFITGGEVLEKPKKEVIQLIDFLKQFDKKIWLFTRFTMYQIDKDITDRLDYIKVGKYNKYKKGKKECFGIELASRNQDIFHLKKQEEL